jgi:hypothetical protein
MSVAFDAALYAAHPGPYQLHMNTNHGVYHHMGEYETDYVHYAFKDTVSNHSLSYVWVTDADGVTLEAYDKDHDDYLDY